MKQSALKSIHAKFMVLLLSCFVLISFSAKAGGDSYEIYLNNKLILKQYQFQTLSLTSLNLNRSNIQDQLVIYYAHCSEKDQTGKGRSIVIKDAQGKTLKEWKFSDASGDRSGMTIPVKDLLDLQNGNAENTLTIYYSSAGHPQSKILSSLKLTVNNAS